MPTHFNIWDFQDNFRYDGDPLMPEDDLWVELGNARGDYNRRELFNQLRVDWNTRHLRGNPQGLCVLFGGHRGSGKSTELRLFAQQMSDTKAYHIVLVDALRELDIFNLDYSDLLLAQVSTLAKQLPDIGITLENAFVSPLHDWFDTRIERIERTRKLSAEIRTGAEASTGLPLVGKLFARLTTAIQTNATYKDEIRREVRDGFSELAGHFDKLIGHVAERLKASGKAHSLLFIIDGTDRLLPEDAENFFIHGVDRLRLIRKANLLICAPIRILIEHSQTGQNFEGFFRLPMIKLQDKTGATQYPEAHAALRKFIIKRLPEQGFETPALIDWFIDHSGGHPRDLIRLINLSFNLLFDDQVITQAIAEKALKRLAGDYQNVIEPDDYALLVDIDSAAPSYKPVTERTRRLLYDLVLLEYNDSWWQTHPAIRTLPAYQQALEDYRNADHAS